MPAELTDGLVSLLDRVATRNIDILRCLATLLLVAYHVIGIDKVGGMHVADSSAWRFSADLLVDVRMPLFAFIAGVVYALRPISLDSVGPFMRGKCRRLVVPGLIAALIFWILGNTLFFEAFSSKVPLLDVLLLANGHFWFLQAILILFFTVGILDAALQYRAAIPIMIVAFALALGWDSYGIETPSALELGKAVALAPGFLMGMVVVRHQADLRDKARLAILCSAILLLAGLWMNIEVYWATGRLSQARMDAQSLMVSAGAIGLLYLTVPVVPWCNKFAVVAFTVYLYHPFGTSFARRSFDWFGVEAGPVRFTSGVLLGVAVPIVVHLLASRFSLTRRLLLGLRLSGKAVTDRQTGRRPRTL